MDIGQTDAILNLRCNTFNVVFGRVKKCQLLKTTNSLQHACQQHVKITTENYNVIIQQFSQEMLVSEDVMSCSCS